MQFAVLRSRWDRIVTASDDATARIWDTHTPPIRRRSPGQRPRNSTRYRVRSVPRSGCRSQPMYAASPAAHSVCDELAGAPFDPDRRAARCGSRSSRIPPIAPVRGARAASVPIASTTSMGAHWRPASGAGQRRAEFEQALTRGYRGAAIDLARLLTQRPPRQSDGTRDYPCWSGAAPGCVHGSLRTGDSMSGSARGRERRNVRPPAAHWPGSGIGAAPTAAEPQRSRATVRARTSRRADSEAARSPPPSARGVQVLCHCGRTGAARGLAR